jgi:hypothetical protein
VLSINKQTPVILQELCHNKAEWECTIMEYQSDGKLLRTWQVTLSLMSSLQDMQRD